MVPLAALVIVGSSNAVNLTDGLDGLAGGCLVWACGAVGVVAYASGHAGWARLSGYSPHSRRGRNGRRCRGARWRLAGVFVVQLPSGLGLHGRRRLAAAGRTAGTVGRRRPAGAAAGGVGGVFVVEAASVIVQVAWFRWRQAARVAVRSGAPSLSIAGLARRQDRGAVLDRAALCAIAGWWA